MFPKWLGVLLIVEGVCYLVDMLAAFLVRDVGQTIHAFVVIPSAIAELSMVGYLLVVGVKTVRPSIKSEPVRRGDD
jgi:bacteriorhodopsin